jgi:hypothetical protein
LEQTKARKARNSITQNKPGQNEPEDTSKSGIGCSAKGACRTVTC